MKPNVENVGNLTTLEKVYWLISIVYFRMPGVAKHKSLLVTFLQEERSSPSRFEGTPSQHPLSAMSSPRG